MVSEEIKEQLSSVAITILEQIGNKALVMMGTKRIGTSHNYVNIFIGKNAKKINRIIIKLNEMDLYDVEFWGYRKKELCLVSEHNDVYFDKLHTIIESNTGLYLSL